MSERAAPSPAMEAGANPGREGPQREHPGLPRVVTSEALLAGASQLAILHDRTIYFLRRTRFGKLILTK